MKTVLIKKLNDNNENSEDIEAWYLESFLERLKGLMFQKDLPHNQAALFINNNETILDSAIHMLFMNFDISVFWLNKSDVIVDKKIAKKWSFIISPSVKAQKILEAHVEKFDKLNIGDQLIIEIN